MQKNQISKGYQAVSSGYQGASSTYQAVSSTLSSTPPPPTDPYTGAGILKRFIFLVLKGMQSYICTEILLGVGGIYAVDGELFWYIPALVYVYTLTQLFEFVFAVSATCGIQMVRDKISLF